jgi:hypothetical protein
VDELLEGLKFRDFMVLTSHLAGSNPRSPQNLFRLRRGPVYVGAAERRLLDRGLLQAAGDAYEITADGVRAVRTGAVLFELESFDASRYTGVA